MYAKVILISCFMARCQNSNSHSRRALQNLRDLLITFDHKVFEMVASDFGVIVMNPVGGVRQSTTCEHGQKDNFLLGLGCGSKRLFGAS